MNTIVAIITPPGKSGIGVIRLSGSDAVRIIQQLINEPDFIPLPRRVYLKKIIEPQNREILDETIITYFKAPQSFTGEDVVEISAHGSPLVLRRILDACLALDARPANPGEFSLRALANGQINLAQAEAIRDLIDAQTTASARQAIRQLRGEFSASLQPLKDRLLEVIVVLESNLEFVEDDLPTVEIENLKSKLSAISLKLIELCSTFRAGKLLRNGLKIAFAGRPNVGKSSVFNSLIGYERAIVTEIAGTTRDSLQESISIQGIPIILVDTAGLRETEDVVESIGVARTKKIVADADLVLLVFDATQPLDAEDLAVLTETNDLNRILVVNKIDLGISSQLSVQIDDLNIKPKFISAKSNIGLDDLINEISDMFSMQDIENKGFVVSDARHFDLLKRAEQEITKSVELLGLGISEEIVLLGLHSAIRYLGEITGEVTTEDMLTKIFSTFCIGK